MKQGEKSGGVGVKRSNEEERIDTKNYIPIFIASEVILL